MAVITEHIYLLVLFCSSHLRIVAFTVVIKCKLFRWNLRTFGELRKSEEQTSCDLKVLYWNPGAKRQGKFRRGKNSGFPVTASNVEPNILWIQAAPITVYFFVLGFVSYCSPSFLSHFISFSYFYFFILLPIFNLEAASYTATQELPQLLCKLCSQGPPTGPYPKIHQSSPYYLVLCNTNFNIMHSLTF